MDEDDGMVVPPARDKLSIAVEQLVEVCLFVCVYLLSEVLSCPPSLGMYCHVCAHTQPSYIMLMYTCAHPSTPNHTPHTQQVVASDTGQRQQRRDAMLEG